MTKLLDRPGAEPGYRALTVHVAHVAKGGWDVIAMMDQCVMAIHHCEDWHRAERAYQRMKADQLALIGAAHDA